MSLPGLFDDRVHLGQDISHRNIPQAIGLGFRRLQHGHEPGAALLALLEEPKSGAHNFAHVVIAAVLDTTLGEEFEFGGQTDVGRPLSKRGYELMNVIRVGRATSIKCPSSTAAVR
jgi:hypothetical protein